MLAEVNGEQASTTDPLSHSGLDMAHSVRSAGLEVEIQKLVTKSLDRLPGHDEEHLEVQQDHGERAEALGRLVQRPGPLLYGPPSPTRRPAAPDH